MLRFFTPGATAFDDATSATSLPATAAAETVIEAVRSHFLPAVHPGVRSPAAFVRGYRAAIHVPRPLLALLALASLLALALRVPARREVLLLSGSAIALILGTAATAGFGLRYLLGAVPLLAIGGTLALRDTSARWSSRRPSSRPNIDMRRVGSRMTVSGAACLLGASSWPSPIPSRQGAPRTDARPLPAHCGKEPKRASRRPAASPENRR